MFPLKRMLMLEVVFFGERSDILVSALDSGKVETGSGGAEQHALQHGDSNARRNLIITGIINGTDVTQIVPWMVSFTKNGHRCGGVIISKSLVLTAAHCEIDHTTTVHAGFTSDFSTSRQQREIERCYPRSSFKGVGDNDIAVCVVYPKWDFVSSGISAVDLPSQDVTQYGDVTMDAFGWGVVTGNYPHIYPNNLQWTSFRYLKPRFGQFYATPANVGGHICDGDSGGPLVISGTKTIVGITSAGDENCTSESIFTDVYLHLGWIESFMRDFTVAVHNSSCPADWRAPINEQDCWEAAYHLNTNFSADKGEGEELFGLKEWKCFNNTMNTTAIEWGLLPSAVASTYPSVCIVGVFPPLRRKRTSSQTVLGGMLPLVIALGVLAVVAVLLFATVRYFKQSKGKKSGDKPHARPGHGTPKAGSAGRRQPLE